MSIITTADKNASVTTYVKFGTAERASLAVGCSGNFLTLQQLATEKKFGEDLKEEDIQEFPKIEMEFFDTKSIDVMIKVLEEIKKNMNPPWMHYALAC